MNNKKTSNLLRLIAFFLTSVILVCTFGFTVDGWIDEKSDDLILDNQTNNKPNIDNNDESVTENEPIEPEIIIPEFINKLTGTETDKATSEADIFAFVLDGNSDLYGISESDVLIDIPIENNNYRTIMLKCGLGESWKIGPISSSRGYISNFAKYFGAIGIYNKLDDFIDYESCDMGSSIFDFDQTPGYHYSETSGYSYTNSELVALGLKSKEIVNDNKDFSIPFSFVPFEKEEILYANSCKNVLIKQSNGSQTEIIYDERNLTYSVKRNNVLLRDFLNDKEPRFANCLVLFADSTVYDNLSGNQMIVNTIGNGKGLLATNGTFCKIEWTATTAGVLSLSSTDGTNLFFNRGSTYICVAKSSSFNNTLII